MDSQDLQKAFFGTNPLYTNEAGYTDNSQGFLAWISAILPNVFILAGVLLFLYILFGGFLIITGAGDTKQTDTGKQALTNAIIGFVIVFASYWIIQIVEIVTGVPILK
jgi:hypothetical protein